MSPSIVLPVGINVVALVGVVVVASFTVVQVLATTPLVRASGTSSEHIESRESYAGIVSWVSRDSISIIDSVGVNRTIDIDANTKILRDESLSLEQKYYDIRQFDYVRVEAMRSAGFDRALVILDIR